MHFRVKTRVPQNYLKVFEQFDQTLFLKLRPPGLRFKLNRFDGCQKGDEVHLEIQTLGIKQNWISLVTHFEKNVDKILFVDEGRKLPRPLKFWKHCHYLINEQNSTLIIDDIAYRTNFLPLDLFLFPFYYGVFFYRKPIYRRFFASKP